MMRVGSSLLAVLLALVMAGCSVEIQGTASSEAVCLDNIPAFSGEPYVVIGDNRPDFEESEFTTNSFESYSPLDDLGRCHTAYACVGVDLMPTEERGSIGSVKPSGWQTAKYDCVEGKYLYNRCHLIGFQLTGENANKSNLITGTRYMNVDGMLPFENMVADYVKTRAGASALTSMSTTASPGWRLTTPQGTAGWRERRPRRRGRLPIF